MGPILERRRLCGQILSDIWSLSLLLDFNNDISFDTSCEKLERLKRGALLLPAPQLLDARQARNLSKLLTRDGIHFGHVGRRLPGPLWEIFSLLCMIRVYRITDARV